MKNKRWIISIIFIISMLIIIGIASIAFSSQKQKIGVVKGATTSPIQVYYYQKGDDKAYEIKEEDSIQSANICISSGKIVNLQKNGEEITFVEDEPLEEGEYSITVESEGKTLVRKFRIDNTAPIISGLEKSFNKKTVTITFENIEDVAVATLKLPKETVDLYALYQKGKLKKNENGKYNYVIEYNEENKGAYDFITKDAAGNIYRKNFKIM